MRTFLITCPALLLMACSANPPNDGENRIYSDEALEDDAASAPAQDNSDGVPAVALTGAEALQGEYRVAGIDGVAIDLPHAMTVSIAPDAIRYRSQCVTAAWRYHFDDDGIILDRVTGEAVCDRARYPEENAIEAAFAAAQQVRRTPANGIEFAGGGHSVTLFSQ